MTKDEQMRMQCIEQAIRAGASGGSLIKLAEQIKSFIEASKGEVMTVKIGDRAIYKPRVPTGRQTELFCFVTRIVDFEKGIVDLVAFPAGGEFLSINNVAPKGELTQIHCWEPHQPGQSADNSELLDLIAGLEARLVVLENRPRAGRPPNAEKAA